MACRAFGRCSEHRHEADRWPAGHAFGVALAAGDRLVCAFERKAGGRVLGEVKGRRGKARRRVARHAIHAAADCAGGKLADVRIAVARGAIVGLARAFGVEAFGKVRCGGGLDAPSRSLERKDDLGRRASVAAGAIRVGVRLNERHRRRVVKVRRQPIGNAVLRDAKAKHARSRAQLLVIAVAGCARGIRRDSAQLGVFRGERGRVWVFVTARTRTHRVDASRIGIGRELVDAVCTGLRVAVRAGRGGVHAGQRKRLVLKALQVVPRAQRAVASGAIRSKLGLVRIVVAIDARALGGGWVVGQRFDAMLAAGRVADRAGACDRQAARAACLVHRLAVAAAKQRGQLGRGELRRRQKVVRARAR